MIFTFGFLFNCPSCFLYWSDLIANNMIFLRLAVPHTANTGTQLWAFNFQVQVVIGVASSTFLVGVVFIYWLSSAWPRGTRSIDNLRVVNFIVQALALTPTRWSQADSGHYVVLMLPPSPIICQRSIMTTMIGTKYRNLKGNPKQLKYIKEHFQKDFKKKLSIPEAIHGNQTWFFFFLEIRNKISYMYNAF